MRILRKLCLALKAIGKLCLLIFGRSLREALRFGHLARATRSSTPDWPVGQSFRISRASFACSLRPKKCPAMRGRFLAEAVRFELTNPFELTVFKTVAIDHSATLPVGLDYTSIDALGTYAGQGISPHL